MWRAMLTIPILFQSAFAQGSLCLIGGGTENYNSWSDAPYAWIVQKADSNSIIILATTAQSSWLPNYFLSLGAASAFNYTIPTSTVANDSLTYRAIRSCRGVFIKGGNQWEYVSRWRGTLTEQAIREVFLDGGVVAGTSAGAMIVSEFVFDARFGSAVSRDALRNPRSTTLSVTSDFLRLLPNTLIDTHFHERGRFGRLLTLLGTILVDNGRRVLGIGIEDQTALCVEPTMVGQVMGSGSVNFYYPEDHAIVRVEPFQPLVFTSVRYDALVAQFKYHLVQHAVAEVPPSATPPVPGTNEPAVNAVTLFGDALPSSGGWSQFIQSAGGTAVRFVVVAPPSGAAAGQRYVDSLVARGATNTALVLLDATNANSPPLAAEIAQANGIIFTANLSEQFPTYTDSTTLVGQALRSKIAGGVAVAYAHHDAKLAGSRVVFRTELEEFAAYLGKLVLGNGMKALRNLLVMPLIFESTVFDENRCTGLIWGMARSECKTGMYLDEGGYATISPIGIVQSVGSTPVVLVDARQATYVDFSTYRAPGSIGPRQSAALVGATVHVLAGDARLNALTGEVITTVEQQEHMPTTHAVLVNYPNPFNPTTTIRFSVAAVGHVSLRVVDVLGREVAVLANSVMQPGSYEVQWNASGVSGGVYVCRLQAGSFTKTKKLLLLR